MIHFLVALAILGAVMNSDFWAAMSSDLSDFCGGDDIPQICPISGDSGLHFCLTADCQFVLELKRK